MKYLLITIFLLGLNNCIAQNPGESLFEFSEKNAEKISLIQLIANPEKYDGKVIEVKGFLSLEFEGNALYLQKDDYEYFNRKNGVSILASISPEEKKNCHLKFVTVIGKFYIKLYNKMGTDWTGWLITKNMDPALTREELQKI
jgi:hypothetical protein